MLPYILAAPAGVHTATSISAFIMKRSVHIRESERSVSTINLYKTSRSIEQKEIATDLLMFYRKGALRTCVILELVLY